MFVRNLGSSPYSLLTKQSKNIQAPKAASLLYYIWYYLPFLQMLFYGWGNELISIVAEEIKMPQLNLQLVVYEYQRYKAVHNLDLIDPKKITIILNTALSVLLLLPNVALNHIEMVLCRCSFAWSSCYKEITNLYIPFPLFSCFLFMHITLSYEMTTIQRVLLTSTSSLLK